MGGVSLGAKVCQPFRSQIFCSFVQTDQLLISGTRGQLGHGNLDDILEGEAVSIEALEGIKCKAIAAGMCAGWDHATALLLVTSLITSSRWVAFYGAL